ncbi:hypothetical protein [Streptomyces poonensis]|uniref:Secreted protein n=1 Tax=Streptomyces poonensis TaxID=68255 RepID=A0A918PGP0_9ACTN|nr:hypothetical protein [Streptomyces poonensis]GGZ08482.1 hypothetical protein GCM10010365_29710 [Streptomyces poonensis]GLJ90540.1 hypothetical protein GCM10017589_31430 [Streptomyces poonensis]
MFRRTFWFTTGVAAGVWATTKVNRKLKQLTPESLAATAANKALEAGHRIKDRAVDFALDVRDGMAQREEQLGDALGLHTPVDQHELPAPRQHAAIENRTTPKYVEGSTYQTNSYNSYNRNEDH